MPLIRTFFIRGRNILFRILSIVYFEGGHILFLLTDLLIMNWIKLYFFLSLPKRSKADKNVRHLYLNESFSKDYFNKPEILV
jgi:hypothetical protein